METSKAIFLFFLLASMSVAATWLTSTENGENGEGILVTAATHNPTTTLGSEESWPLRRLLRKSGRRRSATSCDEYPKVCHMEGSPGHHCCKNHCVNVKKDNLNCGKCGKKCKHGEECCHGQCVNILYDRRNCGGCHRDCKKGSYCRFGMCSYA